ncbi:hypothetical protein FF125_08285 [Aureibaculum algae]|uniref:Uncharacterized protein n=1 Tax=Aureibaculum algae TaxID=2584122 RepID=A0A5B7TU16_9FLAO|nr:DUF6090 family protein [Aureibaculum algae]QCX38427.1 hypothetical protein FF125_08285 [Aureibaculum algae]
MIKFFRKIRQNLLSEGKTGKYLKYALGEIVLVVIGILIALQINNWNQNRLNRITEIAYLKSIKKEIITNYQFNQSLVINRYPKKIKGLKLAKKFCENEIKVTDTLEFLNNVTYGGVFSNGYNFGTRSSYDELINTGNLQLIKKDTIKNSIANYYAYTDVVIERAIVHSSNFSNYTSELRPFDSKKPTFISKSDQLEMMECFKSIKFKKLVDLELSYAYKVRDYIKNVNAMGEQTINLINQELK